MYGKTSETLLKPNFEDISMPNQDKKISNIAIPIQATPNH